MPVAFEEEEWDLSELRSCVKVEVAGLWRRRMGLIRAQKLCESRGGRPEFSVRNSPYGLCGRKATFEEEEWGSSQLWSCVKVEVDVRSSMAECCFTSTETVGLLRTATSTFTQLLSSAEFPIRNSPLGLCGRKATFEEEEGLELIRVPQWKSPLQRRGNEKNCYYLLSVHTIIEGQRRHAFCQSLPVPKMGIVVLWREGYQWWRWLLGKGWWFCVGKDVLEMAVVVGEKGGGSV